MGYGNSTRRVQNHLYTRSLAHADFSSAVFTHAHFQKIAQIYSLCHFHYINEGVPSLVRFWLLMTKHTSQGPVTVFMNKINIF